MHHAWQKFFLAVTELVEGVGDVRSRLKSAYCDHLQILRLEELPTDLREDFDWIVRMLTRRQPRWEGDTKLVASLKQMRNRTGANFAKKIFDVYRSLEEKRLAP